MNGVRSTFMRKGYLLTALAALLLLAASSGTASAQLPTGTASIALDRTSTSLTEGDAGPANPAGIIKVTRTGLAGGLGTATEAVTLQVGAPMPATDGGALAIALQGFGGTVTYSPGSGITTATVTFSAGSAEVTLAISHTVDEDWADNTYNVALQRPNADIALGNSTAVITVKDANPAPVAAFTKSSIKLVEDSSTGVSVTVGNARGERRPVAASVTDITENLLVTVDPPGVLDDDGFGATGTTDSGAITVEAELTQGTFTPLVPVAGKAGQYTLRPIGEFLGPAAGTTPETYPATPLALRVTAANDTSDYKNTMITVSFEPMSLKPAAGAITDGGSLSIYIESDEEIPTLSFSPTDVTINEGESVETVLIAEGALGSKVDMVKLMVEGDADVSLMQGDKMLEEMDGHVYVNLGTSNSARLTAMSHESRELADGDMAYKAWKLVEGSTDGAKIGEGSWFKVDVVGSTAVPALPLIGQLLLALFLMAGGSRLYRRRQE